MRERSHTSDLFTDNTKRDHARGNQLVRETYSLENGTAAGASVEVVTFPNGYQYAIHDLFGSLLWTAAYNAKESRRDELGTAVDKVRCMDWVNADGTKSGTVCYTIVESGEVPEGVVG